ncbi:MAG: hypothetical protein FK734_15025 [Asgard group archaeon]|nr:hypothetical protein [Asgard group archaeon]
MSMGPMRWATSEGVFLFQVPQDERIISTDIILLLSSSLYAISIFFEDGHIKFNDENSAIIRINFHPPLSNEEQEIDEEGYVIHSSFSNGICFQSIFLAEEINNQLSEFERAFLDSVVNNLLARLKEEGREVSDIPFLRDRAVIDEIEGMLHEIDSKYKSLVASWSLAVGPDCDDNRFDFTEIQYNGKIKVEDLFYDLGERAIESFNQLLMSKEEKIVLYKIAKGLVGLSGLLYENELEQHQDHLNFAHSEIILESSITKKLYRLDVRSYEVDEEQYCDITIMSNTN